MFVTSSLTYNRPISSEALNGPGSVSSARAAGIVSQVFQSKTPRTRLSRVSKLSGDRHRDKESLPLPLLDHLTKREESHLLLRG